MDAPRHAPDSFARIGEQDLRRNEFFSAVQLPTKARIADATLQRERTVFAPLCRQCKRTAVYKLYAKALARILRADLFENAHKTIRVMGSTALNGLQAGNSVRDRRNIGNALLSPSAGKTRHAVIAVRQLRAEGKSFFKHDRLAPRVANDRAADKHIRIVANGVIQIHRDIGKIVFEGNHKRLVPLAHMRHTFYVRRALFHTVALIAQTRHTCPVFPLKNGGRFPVIAARVKTVFGEHSIKRHVHVHIDMRRIGIADFN